MKNIFVALAVLGMIASCTYAEAVRRAEDPNTILAELDSTPFGQTVLSLVSVHLSTNGPLDELIALLNTVVNQLRNDQSADDGQNRTNQANCDSQIATFKKQIAIFTNERNENIKIRDVNQAALNIAEADLRETLAALALNQQRLREGNAERDAQHREYSTQLLERENGIHALDGAIQLVQHLQAGSSFVQLKKRFAKVQQELLETSKNSSFGHLYTPLITALSELAEKASPETIGRILNLFNDLRSQFTKDKQTLTNAENKQQEAWTSLKADLNTEQDQLLEKRHSLEEQIASYKAIIARANAAIAAATKSLETATLNLQHTQEVCTAQSTNYAKRTTLRKAQSGIIQKVIRFFSKRAKATTDFIKARTAKATL